MDAKRKYYIALNRLYNEHTSSAPSYIDSEIFDNEVHAIMRVAIWDTQITLQDFRKIERCASRLSYNLYPD